MGSVRGGPALVRIGGANVVMSSTSVLDTRGSSISLVGSIEVCWLNNGVVFIK